jgi:uncharacterized protein (DUF2249 family)
MPSVFGAKVSILLCENLSIQSNSLQLTAIRAALIEGEESGVVEDYGPQAFVKRLNAEYDAEYDAEVKAV